MMTEQPQTSEQIHEQLRKKIDRLTTTHGLVYLALLVAKQIETNQKREMMQFLEETNLETISKMIKDKELNSDDIKAALTDTLSNLSPETSRTILETLEAEEEVITEETGITAEQADLILQQHFGQKLEVYLLSKRPSKTHLEYIKLRIDELVESDGVGNLKNSNGGKHGFGGILSGWQQRLVALIEQYERADESNTPQALEQANQAIATACTDLRRALRLPPLPNEQANSGPAQEAEGSEEIMEIPLNDNERDALAYHVFTHPNPSAAESLIKQILQRANLSEAQRQALKQIRKSLSRSQTLDESLLSTVLGLSRPSENPSQSQPRTEKEEIDDLKATDENIEGDQLELQTDQRIEQAQKEQTEEDFARWKEESPFFASGAEFNTAYNTLLNKLHKLNQESDLLARIKQAYNEYDTQALNKLIPQAQQLVQQAQETPNEPGTAEQAAKTGEEAPHAQIHDIIRKLEALDPDVNDDEHSTVDALLDLSRWAYESGRVLRQGSGSEDFRQNLITISIRSINEALDDLGVELEIPKITPQMLATDSERNWLANDVQELRQAADKQITKLSLAPIAWESIPQINSQTKELLEQELNKIRTEQFDASYLAEKLENIRSQHQSAISKEQTQALSAMIIDLNTGKLPMPYYWRQTLDISVSDEYKEAYQADQSQTEVSGDDDEEPEPDPVPERETKDEETAKEERIEEEPDEEPKILNEIETPERFDLSAEDLAEAGFVAGTRVEISTVGKRTHFTPLTLKYDLEPDSMRLTTADGKQVDSTKCYRQDGKYYVEYPNGSVAEIRLATLERNLEIARSEFAEKRREVKKARFIAKLKRSRIGGTLTRTDAAAKNEIQTELSRLESQLANLEESYKKALRARYEEARDDLRGKNPQDADIQNSKLAQEFIINEDEYLSLEENERKTLLGKAWKWYTSLPPLARASLNATILGIGIGLSGGAGAGFAAAGASFVKGAGVEALTQVLFRDKTKKMTAEAEAALLAKAMGAGENFDFVELAETWKARTEEIARLDRKGRTKRLLVRLGAGGFFAVDNLFDLEMTDTALEQIQDWAGQAGSGLEEVFDTINGSGPDSETSSKDDTTDIAENTTDSTQQNRGTEDVSSRTNDMAIDSTNAGSETSGEETTRDDPTESSEEGADTGTMEVREVAGEEDSDQAQEASAETGTTDSDTATTERVASDDTAINDLTIAKEGDGVSQIIARQLEADDQKMTSVFDILKKQGFTGSKGSPAMYQFLMEKTGYMDAAGNEIRLTADMIGQGGYQIDVVGGEIVITEVNLGGTETHKIGTDFEGSDYDKGETLWPHRGPAETLETGQSQTKPILDDLPPADHELTTPDPQKILQDHYSNLETHGLASADGVLTRTDDSSIPDRPASANGILISATAEEAAASAPPESTDQALNNLFSQAAASDAFESATDAENWYHDEVERLLRSPGSEFQQEHAKILKGANYTEALDGTRVRLDRVAYNLSKAKEVFDSLQDTQIPVSDFMAKPSPAFATDKQNPVEVAKKLGGGLTNDQATMLNNFRIAYANEIWEFKETPTMTFKQFYEKVVMMRVHNLARAALENEIAN